MHAQIKLEKVKQINIRNEDFRYTPTNQHWIVFLETILLVDAVQVHLQTARVWVYPAQDLQVN